MNGCILYFVKLPVPGQVKTRLAAETSDEAACELYRALVEGVLKRLEDAEMEVVVCYAPEDARPQMVEWLGRDRFYLSQKGADLGRRMENAFRETFFMGYDRAVLIGSDIPGVQAQECESALSAVSPKRGTVGPAGDGGYYLIGFHRGGFVPQAFSGIAWGGPNVFGVTVDAMERKGLSVSLAARHMDIDTLEDVHRFISSPEAAAWEGTEFLKQARRMAGLD